MDSIHEPLFKFLYFIFSAKRPENHTKTGPEKQ